MSRASVSSRSRSTTATSSGSGSGSGSAASSTPRIIGPYTLGGTIGAGIFAEVLLGSDEFRQQVAIKVFNKAAISKTAAGAAAGNSAASHYRSHQFLQIEKEINALRICSHPNIVQFYDVLETESKVYLVMEHLSYGELYDYILSQGRLSEAESGRLFGQVVSAIGLCHDLGVVHRDLKPENILLTENGDLKLVDFGLANYWNTKDDPAVRSLRTQCGSPHVRTTTICTCMQQTCPGGSWCATLTCAHAKKIVQAARGAQLSPCSPAGLIFLSFPSMPPLKFSRVSVIPAH